MGVIYRNEFDSLSGVAWKIDLHDSTFSGSVTSFTTGAGGFQLSYKGITERNDPVLSSTCTIPFIVADSTKETFINTVMTAQEERYTVIIYRNNLVYWVGVMLPDEVQREDAAYPYEVELTYTDGLSRLKDLDYNNAGTAYSGRETLLGHILNALTRTGTIVHYGNSDTFMETRIMWVEEHHQYSLSICPLKYTNLSHNVFYEYDQEGNIEYKSCYYVLETILRAFNARIVQVGGIYRVYQVQDMIIATGYYRQFSKIGTLLSGGTNGFRVTVTDAQRKAGAVYRYMQPIRTVTKTYKATIVNVSDGNWLPVQSLYPTYVGLISEIYDAGTGTTVTFTGTIRDWYSSTTTNTGFLSKFAIYVKKTKLSDSSVEYLSGANTSTTTPTWSSSPAYYTQQTPWSQGLFWGRYSPFNVVTPLITDDCTIEFKVVYLESRTTNNASWTPSSYGIYSYDVFEPFASVSYYDEDDEDQELIYTATNTVYGGGTVASTATLELPDTTIGDGPDNIYIGHLRSYSTSTLTWYNTTGWRIKVYDNYIKLHQLSVNQALTGQRVPVERIQATWVNSSITAVSTLVIGIKVYVPLMITIYPESDEVSGEWYNCITP